MKKQQKTFLGILIIVALTAVILVPQILNPTNKNGAMTILINYKDGTSSTYKSQSIVSQAILSNGQEISNIVASVYMIPSYTGTIASYSVLGTFGTNLNSYTNTIAIVPVNPLPTLTSGSSTLIYTTTITEAQISSFLNNWQTGTNYNLIFTAANFAIQGKFSDNSNFGPIVVATQQVQITLTYSSGKTFNGISISFGSGGSIPTSTPIPTATPIGASFKIGSDVIGDWLDLNEANSQSTSYFTSNNNGQVTSITAYIATPYSGNAKAAIYLANGNNPTTLLAQSNAVILPSTYQWVTFQLQTPITVSAGTTYGLALSSDTQINMYQTNGVGLTSHGPGYGNFASGFSNPFGELWWENTATMNIYASGT